MFDIFSHQCHWGQLKLVENEEEIISQKSAHHVKLKSESKSNDEECWKCSKCGAINNIRDCITKHGSKCIGCEEECYIKSQTETIMRSDWHRTNEMYLIQIEELWQCELCLKINKKTDQNCKQCKKPSPMTLMRKDIKQFTEAEKLDRIIYGFIRVNEYYLQMKNIPIVLFKIIERYYVIDHGKIGWRLGDIKCMSLERISKLKVGDELDHRYPNGKFEPAKVMAVDSDRSVQLKYANISSTVDPWRYYSKPSELQQFAEKGSVSVRPAHRMMNIKVGDKVDINPIYFVAEHSGWKAGIITNLDDKSGQVRVKYKHGIVKPKVCYYWTHLDNIDEIGEYESMVVHIDKTICDLLQGDIEKQERERIDLGDGW